MASISLLCLTGVERAKPVDFIISSWIFTSMPTKNSSLTEKVCKGQRTGTAREVQEQRPMQGKESKKRKRQDKVSAHLFLRDNGHALGDRVGAVKQGKRQGWRW